MQPMRRDAAPLRTQTSAIRPQLMALIRQRSFGRGKIKLASGRESDFYFDMKPTMLHPAGSAWLAELTLDAVEAEAVSPINWRAPEGFALDVFVGARESSAFLRQSKLLADAWTAKGVATSYCEVVGADHFTIIDQLTDPNGEIVERIVSHVPRLSAT